MFLVFADGCFCVSCGYDLLAATLCVMVVCVVCCVLLMGLLPDWFSWFDFNSVGLVVLYCMTLLLNCLRLVGFLLFVECGFGFCGLWLMVISLLVCCLRDCDLRCLFVRWFELSFSLCV